MSPELCDATCKRVDTLKGQECTLNGAEYDIHHGGLETPSSIGSHGVVGEVLT
jgi:hypothetical protein